MYKFTRNALTCVSLMAAICANAQTPADQVISLDTAITIQGKIKQLNDLIGADPIVNQIPKVVSVLSFGDQTKARLLLTSGVTRTYEEGDLINARMRVAAVSSREVVIAITPNKGSGKAKGPVLMPLEFIAGARTNQGIQGQVMGQPGQVVQNGIIPEGLMQNPPVTSGAIASGQWGGPQGQSSGQTGQRPAGNVQAPAAPTNAPAPAAQVKN